MLYKKNVAKPLTDINGDNGKTKTGQSKRIPVSLNKKQESTFEKLKTLLISKYVMHLYPDYQKPFDLTTDYHKTKADHLDF